MLRADSAACNTAMTAATARSEQQRIAMRAGGRGVSHASIDDVVHESSAALVASGQAVGITVAVRRLDAPMIIQSAGFADRARGVSSSAETVYRVGSLTKEFVAAAVLRLCELGALTLEDSLARWLPELAEWGQRASVAQLLAHTSGAPSWLATLAPLVAQPRCADDVARVFDALAHARPESAPGEQWRYSNPGYLILEHIAGRAAGVDLDAFLSRELMQPLGVSTIGECDRLTSHPAAAAAYGRSNPTGVAEPAEYVNMATVGASGAWSASARDLMTWDRALCEGKILSPPSLAMQRTRAGLNDGSSVEYGLGVFLGALGPHREVLHRGDLPGGAAFKATYPDAGVSVIVLANTTGAPVARMGRRIARHVLSLPEPRHVPVTATSEELRTFAGEYRDGRGCVRLSVTDGEVTAQTPDGTMPLRAVAIGGGVASFVTAVDPDLTFEVQRGDDGRRRLHVRGPALHFDGKRWPGPP